MTKRRTNLSSVGTALLTVIAAGCAGCIAGETEDASAEVTAASLATLTELPNGLPIPNGAGFVTTFSTRGFLDFTTSFHQPLGSNGRSCGTCHLPTSAWTVRPLDAQVLFWVSDGTHPLFRTPEANNPTADVSTRESRRAAYSMLLTKAVFRRTFNVPATAEFEVTAVDDPYGVATLTALSTFRRPLVTTNLHLINGVAWENRTGAANGDTHVGLLAQARGNVTGAQQGTMVPPAEVLEELVNWEKELATAQVVVHGLGRLDSCGARGGAEALSRQARVIGPFDLYDGWANLAPGTCGSRDSDARRAQVARGQRLFNTATDATGGTCNGCHNVANSGNNFNGTLFNVGASSAANRTADMPLYTLRNKETGEVRPSTDPGRALISGRWADVDRFKVPTLRGLASRAPYFHNGIANTFVDVIRVYERSLGFDFTADQEADLVAFLNAL